MSKQLFARSQRMTIVNGALVVAILLVIVQLWLLTATMNAFLGGDTATSIPAALASLGCLGTNVWLLRYVDRLD